MEWENGVSISVRALAAVSRHNSLIGDSAVPDVNMTDKQLDRSDFKVE